MLDDTFIESAIPHALQGIDLPGNEPVRGKVRDAWTTKNGLRVLVATDRISAFDRILGTIPFRGQVLNQLSEWWFRHTSDIVANHLVDVPDPNIMVVRNAIPLPIEVVVRGYITGVTSTSLWSLYESGAPLPYGLVLPPGLRKNDPLPSPVITPTTKAEKGGHDERLTSEEVVGRGLVEAGLWEEMKECALALFHAGQQFAVEGGLILVDTKYEFGIVDGKLTLIDEMHTPDSSRFWIYESYKERHDAGEEPEQLDKEVLRMYFVGQGYSGNGDAPPIPSWLSVQMAQKYISAYENLTWQHFWPGEQPSGERVKSALEGLLG